MRARVWVAGGCRGGGRCPRRACRCLRLRRRTPRHRFLFRFLPPFPPPVPGSVPFDQDGLQPACSPFCRRFLGAGARGPEAPSHRAPLGRRQVVSICGGSGGDSPDSCRHEGPCVQVRPVGWPQPTPRAPIWHRRAAFTGSPSRPALAYLRCCLLCV